MKKFIIFLIILSVLIIQCSNEYSGESEKSETEFIEDDADNFVYEKVETNIIKTNETNLSSNGITAFLFLYFTSSSTETPTINLSHKPLAFLSKYKCPI